MHEPEHVLLKRYARDGDPDAFRTMVRMEEHIGWEDKLSLDDMKLTVGKKLLVDAANETVTNDAKAAAILQGTSRAPFVIPDKA